MKTKLPFLLILIMLSTSVAFAADKSWSRSSVMSTSDRALTDLGYDVERFSISFDADNSVWAARLKEDRPNKGQFDYESKNLDEYWAVNYQALDGSDGHVWVFINRKDGAVLNVIQGE